MFFTLVHPTIMITQSLYLSIVPALGVPLHRMDGQADIAQYGKPKSIRPQNAVNWATSPYA